MSGQDVQNDVGGMRVVSQGLGTGGFDSLQPVGEHDAKYLHDLSVAAGPAFQLALHTPLGDRQVSHPTPGCRRPARQDSARTSVRTGDCRPDPCRRRSCPPPSSCCRRCLGHIRDMMLEAVEQRFGACKTAHPVEMPSDNGSCYIARETRIFARQLGLRSCYTPVKSPQSNGMGSHPPHRRRQVAKTVTKSLDVGFCLLRHQTPHALT